MGWNYGYKNLGGLCDTGKIFGAYTDVSNYNLRYDPFYDSDRFRPITKGVAGNDGLGGKLGGLNLGDFRNLQDQTNYVVYRIDVISNDNIRREIVLKGQYRPQYTDFVCKLYLRVYSDDTTYTDTEFTAYNAGSMITGWYPSGGFNEVTQAVYAVFTTIQHDGIRYMLVGLCNEYKVPWLQDQIKYEISCIGIPIDVFTTWLDGVVEPVEESPEYGPASEPDGYGNGGALGNHDKHSDHSGIPAKPQYGFTSAGFLNHYRISAQGLSMLGEALFPEPQGASVDVASAIDKLITNNWNAKIIDYILDCRIIPVTPHDDGLHDITCGGKKLIHPTSLLPYSAHLVDEDFVDVDCGTITTPLCEGNFLDFYQLKCKLFLPFYGFVDIDPEYWMGATIGVYYRFNCMDGSFMCWVTSKAFRSGMIATDVIGQYAGNACIHLPINSQSYAQIVNGLITTGASVVGVAAGGNMAGAAVSAISGAAQLLNSRPTLNKSNSYSGSSALMSKRTPYLLIEFNEAQFSTKYVEEQGLPAVVKKKLSECEGFTVASNPILDGIPCTEAEKERIRSALAAGLIFKNPVTPP